MTRCRCQKLHWRWSGNPNGRSEFHNLGLFALTRSQLARRRLVGGFRRSLKWHVTNIKTSPEWPGSIEIPQIRNFMHTRSSKTSRKTSFCCYEHRRDWWHCALFFPAITGNGFCFHSRKIISRRHWLPPKNRDSIYSKTIDIIRKK